MKKCWIIVFAVYLCFCSGCWDMREINDLGFVTAVGIDKAQPPYKYSVTVQIANAGGAAAKSEQGQAQTSVWVGTASGNTIFAAVRDLIRISSRRIMWAHNNVVIIGEPLARESIIPVVDFFTHNPELRMKTPMVVARGDAKDCILAKAGMETPSGLAFAYFNDYSIFLAETIRSSMLTVSSTLAVKRSEPIIAAVGLRKAEAPPDSNGKSSGEKEAKTIDLAGAAVFNRDKLVGWLTPHEARGIAWILSEAYDTIVSVKDPMHENQNVAVEVHGVKTRIKAKVVAGLPRITIKISGDGSIVEENGRTHQDINQVKAQIEQLVKRKIAMEIKTSLKKIQQEYKVDVINLATFVHAQNNREWENRLKQNWKTIFPTVQFKTIVHIPITSNTLKQEPANHF